MASACGSRSRAANVVLEKHRPRPGIQLVPAKLQGQAGTVRAHQRYARAEHDGDDCDLDTVDQPRTGQLA
jgi:hypothetical protein